MQEANGWNALFWCNHDQPRIVSRLGNETKYWKESAKMLATLVHFMQGTPYIYQGEELGMTNAHFTTIEEYRDVESLNYYQILLENGKSKEEALHILSERSRDNSRTPMQWSAEKNARFSQAEPWIKVQKNYKTINTEVEEKESDSILNFYKKLIQLRKELPVIANGSIQFFDEESEGVIGYERELERTKLVVLCNLCEEENKAVWQSEWDSYELLLGNYSDGKVDGTLRPYECKVIRSI